LPEHGLYRIIRRDWEVARAPRANTEEYNGSRNKYKLGPRKVV
jgi:hypothetical protein